jgi:hypothetical protein
LGELIGRNRRALMAQLVTAILSNQGELAAKARTFTGDVNEAGLLVSKVVSHAFETFDHRAHAEDISHGMRSELDRLIRELRRRSN